MFPFFIVIKDDISMKQYKCHKVVEAGKITEVSRRLAAVRDSDGETSLVTDEFFSHHNPQPGDYLVQYEDGYLSVSPAAAFEAGSAEVTE